MAEQGQQLIYEIELGSPDSQHRDIRRVGPGELGVSSQHQLSKFTTLGIASMHLLVMRQMLNRWVQTLIDVSPRSLVHPHLLDGEPAGPGVEAGPLLHQQPRNLLVSRPHGQHQRRAGAPQILPNQSNNKYKMSSEPFFA